MDNVFESIIFGLTEAIEDAKSGKKKLERNVVYVESVEEHSAVCKLKNKNYV